MDSDKKRQIENAAYVASNLRKPDFFFDVDDFILALGAVGLEIRQRTDPEP